MLKHIKLGKLGELSGLCVIMLMLLCVPGFSYYQVDLSKTNYTISDISVNGSYGKELKLNLPYDVNLSLAKNAYALSSEEILFNKTILNYFGRVDVKLYEKTNEIKNVSKSYSCNCSYAKTGNRTDNYICQLCTSSELVSSVILKEINLSNLKNFTLKKDSSIVEIPEVQKIVKLKDGWGYSAYSNINILGLNIPNMTWYNASYQNKYAITLSNNGTPRNNELTFVDVSSVQFANTNKTDMILVYNDSSIIQYQYMNNKTEIVFLTNTSNSTTYGYALYSNNANVTSWQNTSSIIDIFDKGMFETGEGYTSDSSINGKNGFSVIKDCNDGAQTANDRINASGAFRGSNGLAIPNTMFFFMPNSTVTNNSTTYFTAYISKTTGGAFQITYFSYIQSVGSQIFSVGYGYYPPGTTADGISYVKSSWVGFANNTINTWALINAKLISNGTTILNVTNSTYSMQSISLTPKTSQTYTDHHCLSNFGTSGLSLYDNIFLSSHEINQYLNYTTATLTQEYNVNFNVTSTTPANNTVYNKTLITFNFNVSGTNSTYNCTSYLNSTILYQNTSVNNASLITFNETLNDSSSYSYYTNCSVGNINFYSPIAYFNISIPYPNVTFVNQTPTDISTTSAFSQRVNITYNITSSAGINDSTVTYYYTTNTTIGDCYKIVNGTATCGWRNITYNTKLGTLYSQDFGDAKIYPENDILDFLTYFRNSAHNNASLSNTNQAIRCNFTNMSTTSNYSYYEAMVNVTTNTQNRGLEVDYINASGTSTSIYQSGSLPTWNHTHNVSFHMVVPLPLVGGFINSVKVTSNGYFRIKPLAGTTFYYYYINDTAYPSACQLTNNNGNTWTNLAGTLDNHLHQFEANNTFMYYVCAYNNNGDYNCSSIRSDELQIGGLPPTTPTIIYPTAGIYYNTSNLAIQYIPSVSPNSYTIHYNITLRNNDTTYNKTITANTSLTTYNWIVNVSTNNTYIIEVCAIDTLNQSSCSLSDEIQLNTAPPPFIYNPNKREIVYCIREIINL